MSAVAYQNQQQLIADVAALATQNGCASRLADPSTYLANCLHLMYRQQALKPLGLERTSVEVRGGWHAETCVTLYTGRRGAVKILSIDVPFASLQVSPANGCLAVEFRVLGRAKALRIMPCIQSHATFRVLCWAVDYLTAMAEGDHVTALGWWDRLLVEPCCIESPPIEAANWLLRDI